MDSKVLDFYNGESVMDVYDDDMLFLFYYRNDIVEDNLGRPLIVLRENMHLMPTEVESNNEYFKQLGKYTVLSSKGYTYNFATGKSNYGRDNNFGYMVVSVGSGNNRKTTTMNNLVYRTFVGPIKGGHVIHHINHNKEDNRLSNLAMITRGENLAERFKFNKKLGQEMAQKLNRNYIYARNSKTLFKNKKAVADSVNGLIAGVTACLDGRFGSYKGLDLVQLTDSQMEQLKAYEKEHNFLFFDKTTKMVKPPHITF